MSFEDQQRVSSFCQTKDQYQGFYKKIRILLYLFHPWIYLLIRRVDQVVALLILLYEGLHPEQCLPYLFEFD